MNVCYEILIYKIISRVTEKMLKDKYNMTQEQNIFLAKRNFYIVDSIYKSSHIEGIDITFSGNTRENF